MTQQREKWDLSVRQTRRLSYTKMCLGRMQACRRCGAKVVDNENGMGWDGSALVGGT